MNTTQILQPKLADYTDERGTIQMIEDDFQFGSVSLITSVTGSLRAGHVHATDYHLCVLTKGTMNYYERKMFSQEKPIMVELKAGDKFFTRPCYEHLMEATSDLEFWCFSKHGRQQNQYEADTFRLPHSLREIYHQMS